MTVHPFDDGNGRIARAITDLALARSEQSQQRFYSMSSQIRAERKAYYEALETAQKGTLDVTGWLLWFLACLDRAFNRAETILASVLQKARFWETHGTASLAKCSQDTALRDIDELLSRGLARNEAGGRSTSYSLVLPPSDTAPSMQRRQRANTSD